MKSYTDIKQSRKLAKILPLESADMDYIPICNLEGEYSINVNIWNNDHLMEEGWIPCWSLAALLSLIKDKCGYFEFVYLKRTYVGRANPLENVYRLSTDVYDVYNKDLVDACVEMIIGLKEQNLL